MERSSVARGEVRARAVRGVVVNAAFLVLVDAAVLAQGLVVARLLGPAEVALYGIVSITVTTLIALKRVGIDEAFVQQREPDQEAEFQRAFSLELALAVPLTLLILAGAPVLAAVYDEDRLLLLTVAVAYLPVAFALQAPAWIFFRRMDFVRQRSLQAVVPLTTFAVTVPLVAAGVGVWSLVIGAAAGNVAAVVLALRISPYRLRWRLERAAARRYLAFSWPVFAVTAAGLVVAQGQVLAFKLDQGLAAAGFLALAVALTRYADRADQVVAGAVLPAVAALHDRRDAVEALFERAARGAAVWSLAFGAGFVLFAPDLVAFALGDAWEPATVLLQGFAASAALYQLGWAGIAVARGLGRPRPPAIEAAIGLAGFALLALPGLLLGGRDLFAAALVVTSALILVARRRYLRALLPGVRLGRLAVRAVGPLLPAVGAVLVLRALRWGGEREALEAAAELVLFAGVYGLATWRAERPLVLELLGDLRRRAAPA